MIQIVGLGAMRLQRKQEGSESVSLSPDTRYVRTPRKTGFVHTSSKLGVSRGDPSLERLDGIN